MEIVGTMVLAYDLPSEGLRYNGFVILAPLLSIFPSSLPLTENVSFPVDSRRPFVWQLRTAQRASFRPRVSM